MPTVAGFTTTPVKSMALSRPDHIDLSESGCMGDRRFLCCRGDGQRLSGISKAALMPIRPVYDADAERLTLVFPDGAAVEGDATDVGQPVTVGLFDRDIPARFLEGPFTDAVRAHAQDDTLSLARGSSPSTPEGCTGHPSSPARRWRTSAATPATNDSTPGG